MIAIEWDNLAMIIIVVGSFTACVLAFSIVIYGYGQLSNEETLVTEALLGTMLALYILRLQKKDIDAQNRTVKEIGEATASIKNAAEQTKRMIAEENARDMNRKRFWVAHAVTSLEAVKSSYGESLRDFFTIRDHGLVSDYGSDTFLGILQGRPETIDSYLSEVKDILLQIGPLLSEPSLYAQVLDEANYTWNISLDLKDVRSRPEPNSETHSRLEFTWGEQTTKDRISRIEERVRKVGDLIEKMKTEMPAPV